MIVASSLAKKGHPPIYFLLFVAVCQIIGLALLSTVDYTSGEGIPARYYGYQVLAGFAGGPAFIILHLMVPWVVEARDKSKSSPSRDRPHDVNTVCRCWLCSSDTSPLHGRRDGSVHRYERHEQLCSHTNERCYSTE